MSLSRYFKDKGEFKPKSLVSGVRDEDDDWQPSTVINDDQEKPPIETALPESSHSESPSLDKETIESAIVENSSKPDQAVVDTSQPEAIEYQPPSPRPDIESMQAEAYDAGVAQGLKQAETDLGSTLATLTLVCEQLSSIRETILKNSKNEMVELVLSLSEKIIRHSVTEQNQTIIDTVESAIHQAVKSSEFYIYLHPDDMLIIQDRTQQFISGLNGLENIVVKADPTIERGGCKIESDNCTVDATISSQFKVFEENLRKKG
jgi:flagellar assembly protein FliH